MCNDQSSISDLPSGENLPSRDSFASSYPEDASGRHSCQEASSSQLPETRDGANSCPERKSNQKQNNEPGVLVGTGAGLSLAESESGSPFSAARPRALREDQLKTGRYKLSILHRVADFFAQGCTWEQIERATGTDSTTLTNWINKAAQVRAERLNISITDPKSAIATFEAEDCAPQNHKAGRPRKFRFTTREIAATKAIGLTVNRDYRSSSAPESVRRSIAAGHLRPELADAILAREAAGQPLLTDSLRAEVALRETEVRAYRSPNEALLDYVQSPGSLMLTRDEITGVERFWQPGEAFTIDDGSINFGCCVPMERPGDKCWEKFGVIVGRFQFIPVVDHRTRAILGFSYTARPRDSYRAEDLTATMQTVFAEHGLPRVMFLEYGVSDSKLVNETLRRAGVDPRHVKSPHEKVVEKAFDLLWTKLSGMPGQIGRFRGEMEEENRLLTACKQGYKDPRGFFPTLPQVLAALRQAIAEVNSQRMYSPQYGNWVPGEWFARDAHKVTRRLAPQDAWMFSPVITKPLVVRGFSIATTVRLMPGFSLQFHFGAEFLGDFVGDEVILHFNPFAPECAAMIVLARTGQVLGLAEQTNRHARFARRAFGYGADPDIGHIAARKHAQAMHRTMVAIKNGGQIAAAAAEQRDGLGNVVIAEISGRASVPASPNFRVPASPDHLGRASVPASPNIRANHVETARPAQTDPNAAARALATRARLAAISNQLRDQQ